MLRPLQLPEVVQQLTAASSQCSPLICHRAPVILSHSIEARGFPVWTLALSRMPPHMFASLTHRVTFCGNNEQSGGGM